MRRLAGAALVVALAGGCAARNALPPLQPATQDAVSPNFATLGAVYVGWYGSVAVFGPTGTARIATISQPGRTAGVLTLNPTRALYVGDQTLSSTRVCSGGIVKRYAPGMNTSPRKISAGVICPIAMHVRGSLLYVLNAGNRLGVYNSTTGALQYTVTQGLQTPTAMAFDRSGNLYIANEVSAASSSSGTGTVTVYAPGSKQPSVTIPFSNSIPVALAVDSGNHVYVGSYSNQPFTCASSSFSGGPVGEVTVLAPKSTTVLRQITSLLPVTALAIDRSNNLYVGGATLTNPCTASSSGSSFTGKIAVFKSGKNLPTRAVALNDPFLLALDSSTNLYAADCTSAACSSFVIREIQAGGTRIVRNLSAPSQPAALLAQ